MYLLALTLGLSCGAGCGSVVTPFMTSYVIGRQKNKKEVFKSMLIFSLGKILIMMILGGLTAAIGQNMIELLGGYVPFHLNYLFNGVMVLFGIYLVYSSLKVRKSCKGCSANAVEIEVSGQGYNKKSIREYIALFVSGVVYGITPCAPLGIMLATVMGKGMAGGALLLGFFGSITCLSPALIQIFIAGLIIPKMKQEIPLKIHWISFVSGCIMIFLGALPWIQTMG